MKIRMNNDMNFIPSMVNIILLNYSKSDVKKLMQNEKQ